MAEETVREEKDFVHEIELHVVEKQVPQIEATSLTSPNSNTEIEEENQESEEEEEEKESEEEEEKEDPKFIETDQDQENFNYIQTYHIFENEDDRKGKQIFFAETEKRF